MKQIAETIQTLDPTTLRGIPTGFTQFDEATGGLCRGELTVVAGQRGLGKTALLVDLALKYGKDYNVGIFSMEMPEKQLQTRMVGVLQQCSFKDLAEGNAEARQDTRDKIAELHLYINEGMGISVDGMYRIIKESGIAFDVLLVDHYGCIARQGEGYQSTDRVCMQLKGLAVKLNCIVVLFAHLNRAAEQREDHRPRLVDCREGAALENFGNKVILLYRPAFYNKYEEGKKGTWDDSEMYFILAKCTNGAIGDFPVVWLGETMSFKAVTFELEGF